MAAREMRRGVSINRDARVARPDNKLDKLKKAEEWYVPKPKYEDPETKGTKMKRGSPTKPNPLMPTRKIMEHSRRKRQSSSSHIPIGATSGKHSKHGRTPSPE